MGTRSPGCWYRPKWGLTTGPDGLSGQFGEHRQSFANSREIGDVLLMPEGVGQLFSLLATAFGIASCFGFGLMRGRVSSLREELKDERDGRASAREEVKELRAELLVARNDLAALGRVVTAEAHWVAIGERLDTHHHDATAYWARSEQTAADTLAAIRALTGETS